MRSSRTSFLEAGALRKEWGALARCFPAAKPRLSTPTWPAKTGNGTQKHEERSRDPHIKMRSHMKSAIASVESCLVRMPLKTVVSFATRTVAAREYVLVRVTSQDGASGIGLTYAGTLA